MIDRGRDDDHINQLSQDSLKNKRIGRTSTTQKSTNCGGRSYFYSLLSSFHFYHLPSDTTNLKKFWLTLPVVYQVHRGSLLTSWLKDYNSCCSLVLISKLAANFGLMLIVYIIFATVNMAGMAQTCSQKCTCGSQNAPFFIRVEPTNNSSIPFISLLFVKVEWATMMFVQRWILFAGEKQPPGFYGLWWCKQWCENTSIIVGISGAGSVYLLEFDDAIPRICQRLTVTPSN